LVPHTASSTSSHASGVAPLAGFATLGLAETLVAQLAALGYEEPTPIQREAIPPLLAGSDVLGQAATGTGKTAAFALPLLHAIIAARAAGEAFGQPSALVLTPTRELAIQVAEATYKYGRGAGITVLPIYGGADMRQQLRALSRGVDVVVATPGRALDHVRRKSLVLSDIRTVVLDEADEMLDMGFAEDLDALLTGMPAERQTALFSATMAPRVAAVANRHLRNPVRVAIAREAPVAGVAPRVRQVAYVVSRSHKSATLGRVLDMERPTSTLVFCRTRTEVDVLTESLAARGYRADALHGGMSQDQRDRVMKKFRAQTSDLLIATDVAARGLDVTHLSHVVNYDVPTSTEAYIHRIGRTGRAGREGIAITLLEPREHGHLRTIERATKQKIEIATIPTLADLRARRLELTGGAVRETLMEGGLDAYRTLAESLMDDEYDVIDVAAAAIKTAHEAMGYAPEQEAEIPVQALREERGRKKERKGGRATSRYGFSESDTTDASGAAEWTSSRAHGAASRAGADGSRGGKSKAGKGRRTAGWEVARLYIAAGRRAKIRPGDIVGAIANEVGVDSGAVGAIEIHDAFSLVEVPESIAEDVVHALRHSTIKGKKVRVRRDREL
jgi:ATP-dependent RNA helicase DeaD